MARVKVTQHLYKRQDPSQLNQPVAVMRAGTILEVEGPVEGQKLLGKKEWYKDSAGFYYWGGGLKEIAGTASAKPEASPAIDTNQWWFSQYFIHDLWAKGIEGEGVKIALLDSGIETDHPDLAAAIAGEQHRNFVDKNNINDIKDIDADAHGTRCAGIIAGRGVHKVKGLAPKAKLCIAKIGEGNPEEHVERITEAIKWAAETAGADIISMSLELLNKHPKLEKMISDIDLKKKIIFSAAAGNGGQLGMVSPVYPASYSPCVSVGAIDSAKKRITVSNFTEEPNFILVPGSNIFTTDKNKGATSEPTDTSIATAYFSGVLALLLSHIKRKNLPLNAKDVVQLIMETTDPVSEEITNLMVNPNTKKRYTFRVINPRRAFMQLSQPIIV